MENVSRHICAASDSDAINSEVPPRRTPAFLDEVLGQEALDWVRIRNERTEAALSKPDGGTLVADLEARLLSVLDSPDRIPLANVKGEYAYNFWTDGEHPRGLWRREPLEDYLSGKDRWEVLLDVDALASQEGKSWVWHGASICPDDHSRALITLSEGGSDADETREFDLTTLTFIDDGFFRPAAKGALVWLSADVCWLSQPGPEGATSPSGYPLRAALWRRGTPIDQAQVILAGQPTDMGVWAGVVRDRTGVRSLIEVREDFYTSDLYLLPGEPQEIGTSTPVRLPLPRSAESTVWNEWVLVWLREDWEYDGQLHPAGSLLALETNLLVAGNHGALAQRLFSPTEHEVLEDLTLTRDQVVITTIQDVVSATWALRPSPASGNGATLSWVRVPLSTPHLNAEDASALCTVSVRAVESAEENRLWMTVTGYTEPTSLWLVDFPGRKRDEPVDSAPAPTYRFLRSAPELFDATDVTVSQHFATSEDATKVPYFEIRRADVPLPAPALLYGYGGFDVSLLPAYTPTAGRAWVEDGGVYVVANIRGGGEYGPAWHRAALKENRHRAYEDFVAVARDLVARGITTHAQLGAQGGSNGGLLMGNMYTQYPEDFGAILCQVPLLDMRRYHHLLAGSSWVAEYGDPDDEAQWDFIRTFSPVHLFSTEANYPPLMLTTSTKDDRVHPGHARSLGYLAEEAGKPILYFENIEGGHGGAADNQQRAHNQALGWAFLRRTLGL